MSDCNAAASIGTAVVDAVDAVDVGVATVVAEANGCVVRVDVVVVGAAEFDESLHAEATTSASTTAAALLRPMARNGRLRTMGPGLHPFHRAVAATVIDVAAVPTPGPDRESYPDLVDFVDGQLAALPGHLRFGVGVAAALLAAGVVVTKGRRFEQLPAATKTAIVERWTESRLPTTQHYLRMMRQLSLFVSYESAKGT